MELHTLRRYSASGCRICKVAGHICPKISGTVHMFSEVETDGVMGEGQAGRSPWLWLWCQWYQNGGGFLEGNLMEHTAQIMCSVLSWVLHMGYLLSSSSSLEMRKWKRIREAKWFIQGCLPNEWCRMQPHDRGQDCIWLLAQSVLLSPSGEWNVNQFSTKFLMRWRIWSTLGMITRRSTL